MKRSFSLRLCAVTLLAIPFAAAADTASAVDDGANAANATAAAAALATGTPAPRVPDILEHLVDVVLELFNVKSSGNTVTHYVISALFLVIAILLRRFLTTVFFNQLKKLAAKTETTLDDKLFPAMESPVATFVLVTGIFAALKVLKLSETADRAIGHGSTVAFSLVIFWGLLRAFDAIIDHAAEIAREKQMGIAALMPWIKKSLMAMFVIVGGLMTVQSLGYNVSTILQGLGIGGLAFALAAQDTIANLFGSIVVAIDQPFKVGEVVRIGTSEGKVEDIGLRSTKIRTGARTLIIIPNKLVASEPVTNFTRMPQRRVDQSLGLSYQTTAEQMQAVLEDIRQILRAEAGVHPQTIAVNFTGYGASSLDLQLVYFTADPDWQRHLDLRERVNLAIMRAVAARGTAFAFPTPTVILDGPVARSLVPARS